MPISTLKGDLTFWPSFRFLKYTLAPAGTSGRAVALAIESAGFIFMAVSWVAGGSFESPGTPWLSPGLFQGVSANSQSAGKKMIISMVLFIFLRIHFL